MQSPTVFNFVKGGRGGFPLSVPTILTGPGCRSSYDSSGHVHAYAPVTDRYVSLIKKNFFA